MKTVVAQMPSAVRGDGEFSVGSYASGNRNILICTILVVRRRKRAGSRHCKAEKQKKLPSHVHTPNENKMSDGASYENREIAENGAQSGPAVRSIAWLGVW